MTFFSSFDVKTVAAALFLLLAPDGESQARTAVEALSAGMAAREAGRLDAAIADLGEAAKQDSELADVSRLMLAQALLDRGEIELALGSARMVMSTVDSVWLADARWLIARCHAAASRHEEAALAWARFADRHPKDSRAKRARVRHALALESAGSTEGVQALRSAALKYPALAPKDALKRAAALAKKHGLPFKAPNSTELMNRADSLAGANRHDWAVDAYDEARAAMGKGAAQDKALIRKAKSLYRQRKNEESLQACLELDRTRPDSEYRTASLHRRVRVAWRRDDGAAVLAGTKEAIDDPRHRQSSWRDDLIHVRAGYFLEQGQWDEAVKVFEMLIKTYPDSKLVRDAHWKSAWCRMNQGRPREAARSFGLLAKSSEADVLTRGGSYWQAMALERAGDQQGSVDRLEDTHRRWPFSYHGVLAREALATRMSAARLAKLDADIAGAGVAFVSPGPPDLSSAHGRRYALLRDAGLFKLARPELEALRRSVPDTDALVFELAQARSRAGAASSAVGLLSRRFGRSLSHPSRQSAPEFWAVAYPQPDGARVRQAAKANGLDPALVAGLIRSESYWEPSVRSSADARGLMQLIPPTARRMARLEGIRDFDPAQLFDPAVNVRLGTRYLAELSKEFGGSVEAVVASYNAGEDKVGQWWRDFDDAGVDFAPERVARIPYKETRRYVRRVLEAAAWYRWLEAGQDRS